MVNDRMHNKSSFEIISQSSRTDVVELHPESAQLINRVIFKLVIFLKQESSLIYLNLFSVNFTADDIRSEAKETCNNWFYKISCIRELLPRM